MNNPLLELSRSEVESLIDNWIIGNNAQRDREILKRRLIDGLSYYQLSAEFNLSLPQIKTIIKKRQEHLFKHIKSS